MISIAGFAEANREVIGHGVATIVVTRWEKELDPAKLREALTRPLENGETKSS